MADPSRDAEFWTTRTRALAALARADALAVVLPLPDGRYVPFATHNVGSDDAWLVGSPQVLLWSALRQRTVQSGGEAQVTLSDGRAARSVAVAPIPWRDRLVGVVIALREAPAFDLDEGAPIGDLASLVGVELAVSSHLHRAEAGAAGGEELSRAQEDRRHAIALYEAARLGLARDGAVSTAAMLADSLGFAVVGIWVDDDGMLRLEDGHGYPGIPAPLRVDADPTLVRVVRGGATQRVRRADGAKPWMGPAAEVLVAPLTAAGTSTGLLVLGQPSKFSDADVRLAPSLAEMVALARAARGGTPTRAPTQAKQLAQFTATEKGEPAPVTPVIRSDAVDEAPASAGLVQRAWFVAPLVLAILAAAAGAIIGEPLVLVAAAVLFAIAIWGWLGSTT